MIKSHYSLTLISILLMAVFTQPVTAEINKDDPAGATRLPDVIVVAEVKADEVWELKQSGKIMALEDLIKQVRRDYPGRIIEIELDDEDGRYIYELELVNENGTAYELELDAGTGEVLKYEQDD